MTRKWMKIQRKSKVILNLFNILAEIMWTESSLDEDLDIKINSKKWFWRVHDTMKIRWDLFIIFLAIWNSIQIPYSIAFSPDQEQSVLNTVTNLIVDSFFITDVLINFRSSYMEQETGQEIFSNKRVWMHYIKGNHTFHYMF